MKKLCLYDQTYKRNIELHPLNESVVFGRGHFECFDKRISRHHGEITVLSSNTEIKIKSCHANPIFFTTVTNQSLSWSLLAKDAETVLGPNDKFSLLPNEFVYEVRVIDADSSKSDQITIKGVGKINDNLINGNINLSSPDIRESVEDPERTPSPETLFAPNQCIDPNADALAIQTNRKRYFDANEEGNKSDGCKKQRPSSSAEELPTTSTRILDLHHNGLLSILIKPDPDAASCTTIKIESSVSGTATSESPSIIGIKSDPDGTHGSKSETNVRSMVKPDSDSSKSNGPTTVRPSCEFGIGCYRNMPEHRRDIAHPLDIDYRRPAFPPAPLTVPQCPFGASCYRRNPDHFRNLQHPPSNVYSTQPVIIPPNLVTAPQSDDEDADYMEGDIFDDSEADQNFEESDVLNESDEEDNNLEE